MSKIHRNEPCPCGSGKKYKKCCMNQAAAANEAFSEHVAGQSFIRRQLTWPVRDN